MNSVSGSGTHHESASDDAFNVSACEHGNTVDNVGEAASRCAATCCVPCAASRGPSCVAHLPEHDDGAGRLRVAAAVSSVRAHVVRVGAAAVAAAEQLVHLRRVEQPQPRGRDHLQFSRAALQMSLATAQGRLCSEL